MKIVVDYISIKMWGLVTTGTCLRSSDQGFLAVLRSRLKTIIKLLLLLWVSLPKRLRETKSVHVYESIVNPTFLWVLLNCLLLVPYVSSASLLIPFHFSPQGTLQSFCFDKLSKPALVCYVCSIWIWHNQLFEPTFHPQIPTASLKPHLSSLRCFV